MGKTIQADMSGRLAEGGRLDRQEDLLDRQTIPVDWQALGRQAKANR
jgi:hypothetical protein